MPAFSTGLCVWVAAILTIMNVSAAPGVINTVAGRFGGGFSGDGGDARLARISYFEELSFNSRGDLIFADASNHRIRLIDAVSGVVTTICGDGTAASTGDGGLAVDAKAHTPTGLVIDASDNIYFSEPTAHRVRRIDSVTNVVTTIAGTGGAGYSGDGGAALVALLNQPGPLAIDGAGNLFILDRLNNVVRRIDSATRVITTIAGGAGATFTGDGQVGTETLLRVPNGIAADLEGNVFISELAASRVRRVDAETGIVSTAMGTGEPGYNGDGKEGPETQITFPCGLTFREDGKLYLSDAIGSIRVIDLKTSLVSPVAGLLSSGGTGPDGGMATMTRLRHPGRVAFDSAGNAYFSDDAKIRKIEAGEFRPSYRPDLAIGAMRRDLIGLNRYSNRGVNQSIDGSLNGPGRGSISLSLVNRSTSNDLVAFNIFGVNRFIQASHHCFPDALSSDWAITSQGRTFAMASGDVLNIQGRYRWRVKRGDSISKTYTYVVRSLTDPSKIDVGKFRLSGKLRK